MNTVLGLAMFAGALASGSSIQGDPSDAEILAMGHSQWIARVRQTRADTADELTDAEKRFAIALGTRNNQTIKARPDRKELEDLLILIANVTKGACRIADYAVDGTGNELLYGAKAHALATIALDGYIANRPNSERINQAEVWRYYRETMAVQVRRREKISEFHRRHGGYTYDYHLLEYAGLGKTIARTIKSVSASSDDQKRHIFRWCARMVNLTRGEDPLPYEAPA